MRIHALPALLTCCLAVAKGPSAPLQGFTLPNGLRVVLLEDHANPLLRLSLRVTWEPADEPFEKEGCGSFLGALLERGGAGYQSRPAFDRSVAASGVRVRFEPRANRLEWNLAAGISDQEAALQALSHLVMRPTLDGPSVESLRLDATRALESTAPLESLRQRFTASLQGLPYPDERALYRIGLADLEGFHRRVVRPERAVLGMTGDLNLAQAKTLALLHLGTWGPAPVSPQAPGLPPHRLMSHPEGAPEAWLGVPILAPSAKARAAAELLALILDRGPDSLLQRGSKGSIYLFARATTPRTEALPDTVQALQRQLDALSPTFLTPKALEEARTRWRREEALLPLNPGPWLDRSLERSLGLAPESADVDGVILEDLRALLATSLGSRHLVLLGVPKATLATWLRESPALAPWRGAQTEIPKRDAKSR